MVRPRQLARFHQRAALITLVSLLGLFFATLTLRAQQSSSANQLFVDALWAGTADGILKIADANGTILFNVANVRNVRTVAIDTRRGVLWAADGKTLRAYNFAGALQRTITVPSTPDKNANEDNGDKDDEDGSGVTLNVNSTTGTVWLDIRTRVHHFDAQGKLLSTVALLDTVRAAVLDEIAGRLWVGSGKGCDGRRNGDSRYHAAQCGDRIANGG